jgi:hypothetical protein
MRSWVAVVVEVVGAIALTTGVALVYVPAAFIVGGILLIVGGEFGA